MATTTNIVTIAAGLYTAIATAMSQQQPQLPPPGVMIITIAVTVYDQRERGVGWSTRGAFWHSLEGVLKKIEFAQLLLEESFLTTDIYKNCDETEEYV